MKPKKFLSLFLTLFVVLVMLCLAACSDGLPWSDSDLSKMIPIPVSTHREVVADEEDAFSVDIYNYSQKMFQDYIAFCDVVGFRKGAETTDATYSAYHVNGAHLELSFLPDEGRMRIDLVSMTSRGFAEKMIRDTDERLTVLEADIASVKGEIDALPVYKIATPGEVNSTMATSELRGFIYRLYPTIEALEERLTACEEKRGVINPETLDEDLLPSYEEQGLRFEEVSSTLLTLRGSAYGLENALDSLHRQKPAPADLSAVEQMLTELASELSQLTQALDSPSFEIQTEIVEEKAEKKVIYLLDEAAFYEGLCETLPALTDLGVTLEKCEDALFGMVESAVHSETDRERYATLETQLLKLRRSHYLSLDAAEEQERVLARYRAGEELFPIEESLAVLPDFPTLDAPLEAIGAQIAEMAKGITELESTTVAGLSASQPLIERAHTTLVKLHLSLTECTETAVKMRRAGTCYPNTSPSSQPVFDGLEDLILEHRRSLNVLMVALEQLERSQNDKVLAELQTLAEGFEAELASCYVYVQSVMNVLSHPELIKTREDAERISAEIGTWLERLAAMQKDLGDRLNAVIEIKTGSLIADEVTRAMTLEAKIYELNAAASSYAESLKAMKTAAEALHKK